MKHGEKGWGPRRREPGSRAARAARSIRARLSREGGEDDLEGLAGAVRDEQRGVAGPPGKSNPEAEKADKLARGACLQPTCQLWEKDGLPRRDSGVETVEVEVPGPAELLVSALPMSSLNREPLAEPGVPAYFLLHASV